MDEQVFEVELNNSHESGNLWYLYHIQKKFLLTDFYPLRRAFEVH